MYKDYVLCKVENSEKPYLFNAPRFSHLKKDDRVIVETQNGEKEATVLGSMTLGDDEEDVIDFIVHATGATIIKKVLKTIRFKELDYSEYEEEHHE
jgi:hypothetical protein